MGFIEAMCVGKDQLQNNIVSEMDELTQVVRSCFVRM